MTHAKPGARFGRLICIGVLEEYSRDGRILALWQCDCGKQKKLPICRVIKGSVRSCGCLAHDTKPNLIHGMRGSRTYASWRAIKERTCNPASKDFKRYGAKGITICDRWRDSFEAFLEDMGNRPEGTSIDRIDNTKSYEPGNCRWATDAQQQQNRRGSFIWIIQGIHFESSKEAAEFFGVTKQTITRWVLGSFDSRRNKSTEKRDDCSRIPRY